MDELPKVIADIYSRTKINKDLIEQHLRALEVARKIQEMDENLILFGGTAAQFYLPSNLQRTSTDIDMITKYPYSEYKSIIETFCEENPKYELTKPEDNLVGTYGKRFHLKVTLGSEKEHSINLEVVSRSKEKLNRTVLDNCSLYGINLGKFILLVKEDIFAKKLVTFDLDQCGIKTKTAADKLNLPLKIGKQCWDINQLYNVFGKEEFDIIGEHICTQIKNEVVVKDKKATVDSCIENIYNVFDSLSLIGSRSEKPRSGFMKRGFSVVKSHLPRNPLITLEEWAASGWNFQHLIKSAQLDNINSKNDRVVNHYNIRTRCKNDSAYEQRVRGEVSHRLGAMSREFSIRGKPTYSLVFKLELINGLN